jgi:hypothetical protein
MVKVMYTIEVDQYPLGHDPRGNITERNTDSESQSQRDTEVKKQHTPLTIQ